MVVLLGLMIFLACLIFLWKETPSSHFDHRELLTTFPKWFVGLVIVLSLFFRPRGKTFVILAIAAMGFSTIEAVYGESILVAVFEWFLETKKQRS